MGDHVTGDTDDRGHQQERPREAKRIGRDEESARRAGEARREARGHDKEGRSEELKNDHPSIGAADDPCEMKDGHEAHRQHSREDHDSGHTSLTGSAVAGQPALHAWILQRTVMVRVRRAG